MLYVLIVYEQKLNFQLNLSARHEMNIECYNRSNMLCIISLQLQIECTWMRETIIDWIFQGPACAVLLINLMFLFRIMWVSD